MPEDNYVSRKKDLTRSFERAIRWVSAPLVDRYGKTFCDAVVAEARREHEALIAKIPFIGGSRNRWTSDLTESAQILALFRALRGQGKPAAEIAEIIYDGMRVRLAGYPRPLLRLFGWLQFTKPFLAGLRRQAQTSRQRTYPGDFVAEVVAGDGREFDWGIDFTECAIQKFYAARAPLSSCPICARWITSRVIHGWEDTPWDRRRD